MEEKPHHFITVDDRAIEQIMKMLSTQSGQHHFRTQNANPLAGFLPILIFFGVMFIFLFLKKKWDAWRRAAASESITQQTFKNLRSQNNHPKNQQDTVASRLLFAIFGKLNQLNQRIDELDLKIDEILQYQANEMLQNYEEEEEPIDCEILEVLDDDNDGGDDDSQFVTYCKGRCVINPQQPTQDTHTHGNLQPGAVLDTTDTTSNANSEPSTN